MLFHMYINILGYHNININYTFIMETVMDEGILKSMFALKNSIFLRQLTTSRKYFFKVTILIVKFSVGYGR